MVACRFMFAPLTTDTSADLTLNRLDRIISVTAFNDNGTRVLQVLNLEHTSSTDAVKPPLPYSDKAHTTAGSRLAFQNFQSWSPALS